MTRIARAFVTLAAQAIASLQEVSIANVNCHRLIAGIVAVLLCPHERFRSLVHGWRFGGITFAASVAINDKTGFAHGFGK